MRRTLSQPSTSSPCSALSSSEPGGLRTHMFIISMLVVHALSPCLLGTAQAVSNQADADPDAVQEHLVQDKRDGSLNKLAQVKNSEALNNPHLNEGDANSNINNQAHPRQEAAVTHDKGNNDPLAQPLQELLDQAQEKHVGVTKRVETVEDKERQMALKRQMEERERVVNEHLKQQGRSGQQSILETQKEQQREQKWLANIHRKSQEMLAERQQRQQYQQTAPPGVNQILEVHDRPQQVVHVGEGHAVLNLNPSLPPLQQGELAKSDISNDNNKQNDDISSDNNKQNDDISNVRNKLSNDIINDNIKLHDISNFNKKPNNDIGNVKNKQNDDISNVKIKQNYDSNNIKGQDSNKADTVVVNHRMNSSFQVNPTAKVHLVASDEVSNGQNHISENRDAKPVVAEDKPQVSGNKGSNNELPKEAEPSGLPPINTADSDSNHKAKDINNGNINSLLGIPIIVNSQSSNLENRNGQNGNVQPSPPNVFNSNNNQWAKFEFNNAQQSPQQQQQPQQQPQLGGINLSWDWEDFSVMFNSYGAAEMKVRRSPHPTTGEPWPMPQYYSKKDDKIYRVSKELHFIPTGVICDVLEEGLTRHLQRTLKGCVEDMYDNLQNAEGSPIEDPALRYERDEFLKAPVITRVEVKVRKPCEKYPSLESDESYDLVIKKRKTYIWANEVWGALRGLETFGHLVWRGTDGFLYIKETVISDYPRFPHRGLHIDTSRHFLFKEVILDILDSMEMNKLNVFHWHIVDDQSFPYESKVYPELSRKGAFHPTYVYSLEDIADIIEFARLRGIRVMPEFDTPGHTYAWGLSRPELLTQCYSGNMPVKGYLGPIDPSKNSTYRFLQTLFKEIVEVFKDQYLHLGGDEVPLGCWQSNPEVAAFAQELAKKPRESQQGQGQNAPNTNFGGGWNMWSDEIRRVYEYYENRLINIVSELGQKRKKGIKYVMWQEVMNNNLQLPNDTIIQVWMGDMADVMRATSMGYQVLYSTCWYLDRIEYGTKWPKYYNCDPVDQSFGFHIDEKKVLGGEAAFWAEYFSNENLIPLMWPRASAAAERLWSSREVKNLDKAAERLTEHRCRMIKRGINAGEINGPGYCLHAPPKRRLFNDTAGCKGGNCSRTHNFVQIEDFEVHVSHRGGSLADCGNVFTQGKGNVFVMLTLALIIFVALYALSKSSSHFPRMRICKNRSILIVFVGMILIYLLCNTTIWMRASEFSGSFHKTLQEDSRSGGGDDDNSNFRPISS